LNELISSISAAMHIEKETGTPGNENSFV